MIFGGDLLNDFVWDLFNDFFWDLFNDLLWDLFNAFVWDFLMIFLEIYAKPSRHSQSTRGSRRRPKVAPPAPVDIKLPEYLCASTGNFF